jgi:4'-phosphopantetheinyl transferase
MLSRQAELRYEAGTTAVYWLEQTEADVPAENDWLSASETVRLDSMRFAKRRADWRLGRWTAKRALAAYLSVSDHGRILTKIEIRAAPCGAPEVFLGGKPAAIPMALSHRAGRAACAVAPAGAALGCDLELIEERSYAFVADYFTAEEQVLVARAPAADRSRLVTLLWSAKESALKALGEGLRLDTRCVVVDPVFRTSDTGERWSPLRVSYTGGQIFHGWWQPAGNLVRTVVAAPAPAPPVWLRLSVAQPAR